MTRVFGSYNILICILFYFTSVPLYSQKEVDKADTIKVSEYIPRRDSLTYSVFFDSKNLDKEDEKLYLAIFDIARKNAAFTRLDDPFGFEVNKKAHDSLLIKEVYKLEKRDTSFFFEQLSKKIRKELYELPELNRPIIINGEAQTRKYAIYLVPPVPIITKRNINYSSINVIDYSAKNIYKIGTEDFFRSKNAPGKLDLETSYPVKEDGLWALTFSKNQFATLCKKLDSLSYAHTDSLIKSVITNQDLFQRYFLREDDTPKVAMHTKFTMKLDFPIIIATHSKRQPSGGGLSGEGEIAKELTIHSLPDASIFKK